MSTDVREQLTDALSSRYAVDRLIGTGGMATVYLARDLRHDRQVALKVLNPELGAVLGVDRFLAEGCKGLQPNMRLKLSVCALYVGARPQRGTARAARSLSAIR